MDSLYKILTELGIGNIALIALAIGLFIDITPIKINPIQFLVGHLGKCFNSSIEQEITVFKQEVNTKFDQLKQEQLAQRETLDKLVLDQENKEISRLRWEIIDFNNSLKNGTKHSREQYRHIIDDSMKYKRMVHELGEGEKDESFVEVIELIEDIQSHYDEKRQDQSALFF